jgi:hypothetical protein
VRKVWKKNVENNNMENCGKFVKRIVWKKCGKEYCEKSVKNVENNNMGKL